MKEPEMVLPDAVLGYRELGIADTGGANAALLDDGQGRINRRRTFWPSTLYRPEVSTLKATPDAACFACLDDLEVAISLVHRLLTWR